MNTKYLGALTVVAALFSAPAKADFADFCVNTQPYATTGAGLLASQGCSAADPLSSLTGFKADQLQGGYQEKIQLDGMGGFASTIVATWASFKLDDLSAFLPGATRLGVDYNLYALVTASGTTTGNIFTPVIGSISLYLDQDFGTDTGLAAIGNDLSFNVGDDILLASGLYDTGVGNINTTGQQFDLGFKNISLTSEGETFFIAPRPFYIKAFSDGDITGGTLQAIAGSPGLFSASGELSASFSPVPEPASIALVGLALVGLGVSKRRSLVK